MSKQQSSRVQVRKTYKRIVSAKDLKGKSLWRYSNWFITISTNVRTISDFDFFDFQDRFADALEELFEVETLDHHVIVVNERFAEPGEAWNSDWVDMDSVNVEAHIEEGETKKGGRVHAHILLEVKHQGHFFVSREGIKKFIDNHPSLPEVKGSFVQVKLVPEGMKSVLSYIRKDDVDITAEEWHLLEDSTRSIRPSTTTHVTDDLSEAFRGLRVE